MTSAQFEVRTFEISEVLANPYLETTLRALSLGSTAGMNTQLNYFKEYIKSRPVNAKAIVAQTGERAIGWALYSKEGTNRHALYDPAQGVLVYMYVLPTWRCMGIGSSLLNECRNLAGDEALCVCPWDDRSCGFYYKNRDKKLFDVLPLKQIPVGDGHEEYSYPHYL